MTIYYKNRHKKKAFKLINLIINYIVLVSLISLFFLSGYIYVWYEEDNEIAQHIEEIKKETEDKVVIDTKGDFPIMSMDFSEYTAKNKDVTSWLNVSAIDLTMPIVQGSDNDFYLNHDIEGKPNKLGWVFVDARSSLLEPTKNTVIYGHNATTGKMFGSLKDFLSLSLIDENNKYIQFNTMKEKRVYEIFSVYITHESDWSYIASDMSNKEFQQFLYAKQDKTENPNFNTSVDGVSEILTFSTCYGAIGTDKRLVIHAKIVTKDENAL